MRTLFVPVLERPIAMTIEKPCGWWAQRCNKFGEVDSVREATVVFAGTEQRPSLEEIPCLRKKEVVVF